MNGCTYGETLQELLKRPMGIFALHGRDGEEDDETSDDDADSKDDETSDDENEGTGKEGEEGKSKEQTETVESLQRKLSNSEEARDRNASKRKQAEKALLEANEKIAKLEKDGTPDGAIKEQNDVLTSANARLASDNQDLRIENALLRDDKHEWQDPETALRLADLSEVEFDEKTNRAVGLNSALDKLAKEKPYLLKPKDDSKGDEKAGDKRPNDGRSTGKRPAPRQSGKQSDAVAEAARLKAKYPALRR